MRRTAHNDAQIVNFWRRFNVDDIAKVEGEKEMFVSKWRREPYHASW